MDSKTKSTVKSNGEESEDIDMFIERIGELHEFLSSGDSESFIDSCSSLIAVIDDLEGSISDKLFTNSVFIDIFNAIFSTEDFEIKKQSLNLFAEISDKVSDDSDLSALFSGISDIEAFVNSFIQPIFENPENIELLSCFSNFISSISSNISSEMFILLSTPLIPVINTISAEFLSKNFSANALPTEIDYFLRFIYVVVHSRCEYDEEVEKSIDSVLLTFFSHINSFTNPSLIINCFWFRISKNSDFADVLINRETQESIYSLISVDFSEKENIEIALATIEVLTICLEKKEATFFDMIEYPFVVLYDSCVSVLQHINECCDETANLFLEQVFEFMNNTVAYNRESVAFFISNGFIDDVIVPLYVNSVSFKVKRSGTEFFFNMMIASYTWADKRAFIESPIFEESLYMLSSYKQGYIKRILSIFISALSGQSKGNDKADIEMAAGKIREILDNSEVMTMIEDLTEHNNSTISFQASTIIDLLNC